LPGDGIYGISIITSLTDLQYYIYADNGAAVTFAPPRAEYEFYTLDVMGDLVINEFLADNETTVTDQDGEYDDWIELYNNGDSEIALNGYHLSDEVDDLDQWTFPDTSISAGSYLIVWADDDEGQEGLHANFKISASGEALYFVNSDMEIIDEVVFGTQTEDISLGRYPNGTGEFTPMTPTFAAENQEGITGVAENQGFIPAEFMLCQNYPNPFNPETTIRYHLPTDGLVNLTVYDIAGKLVSEMVDGWRHAGVHEVTFDASDLASGIYFYRIEAGDFNAVRKMVLIK
jgi:hypothetical protein